MSIPYEYRINDVRDIKSFKKLSFSNFVLSEVFLLFKKSISNSKLEDTIYWCSELFCSGQIEKIYDIFLNIYCKNIHKFNTHISYLLYKHYNNYLKHSKNNGKSIRNIQCIRNNLCELCIYYCFTNKNSNPLKLQNIENSDLLSDNYKSKIKCFNNNSKFIKKNDNEEVKMIMNEISFCIDTNNYDMASYWLSWIHYFEKLYLKKNKEYKCNYRNISNIEEKYKTDYIWLLWEIIIDKCNSKNELYIKCLNQFYKYKFSKTKKNKKIPILLAALKIITSSTDNKEVEEATLSPILEKINHIYKEIKKNEVLEINIPNKQFDIINEIDKLL